MRVDGKMIAHEMRTQLQKAVGVFKKPLSLAVMVTTDDFVTEKYITIKQHAAKDIGIEMNVLRYPNRINTEDFLRELLHVARDHQGIVVQMPLAPNIDPEQVRQLIPITHDVDVYGNTAFTYFQEKRLAILPPVIGAISEILHHHNFRLAGKKVMVVGEGRLVGKPAYIWAEHMGAFVQSINRSSKNIVQIAQGSDVIITGAGSPGLITPDMVKEDVIIMDAGTSEEGGKLAGDVHPDCEKKAALFTPVPGGIGPVAVASLYKNLVKLVYKANGITDYESLQKLEHKEGE